MSCICYPKAKAIQSRVRKQNNCSSFGNKSTSTRIPTSMIGFDLHGQYKTRTGDCGLLTTDYGLRTTDYGLRTTDYGLRTTDYGLRTTDYGLGTKHELRYTTRTKHYGLGIKRGLRYKMRTAD